MVKSIALSKLCQLPSKKDDLRICTASRPDRYSKTGSISHAADQHLADIPHTGGTASGFQTLLFIVIREFRGVAAAVQAFHIHAPTVFLLNQCGAAALGTFLQTDIFKQIHDGFSFVILLPEQYNMFWIKKQQKSKGRFRTYSRPKSVKIYMT